MNMVGVILAGGKSTRMKQDKALLQLNGISLLQRQFELLEKHLGKGHVLVSGDRSEFPHVKDLTPDLGPLEGLRSVCLHLVSMKLTTKKRQSLLVLPVDMPSITDPGLRRLISYKTKLAVTKFYGQQLPIVIHDIGKTLTGIEAIKKSTDSSSVGSLSFNSLFKQIQVEEIPTESGVFFTNVNTPEDWNAALS